MRRLFAWCARVVAVAVALSTAACSDSEPGPQIDGVVQSGGTGGAQGLANALVRLFEAGEGAPRLVATTTSNADGAFAIAAPSSESDGVLFIRVSLGAVELVAVLAEPSPDFVTVNELTTVAAAFSFAQFFDGNDLSGDALALSIAAGMNANLVDVSTGDSSQVLLSSPNADQTNSLRSTRSLANLIASCVRQAASACATVFSLSTPPGGPVPANTLQALVSIARHPALNVGGIFSQSGVVAAYEPDLVAMPDAWTLAVKVNDTGSDAMPFGGTANTVFDDKGFAWINNNTVQGTSTSAMSLIVLQPDGSPADGSDGSPKSPLTGGGVFGAGFGISRSMQDGSIWLGNFGWGGANCGPQGNGAGCVAQFAADGDPISPDTGYDGGTDRVQGVVADSDGNIWTANFGNDKLIVFPDGDDQRPISADLPCHPFGIAIAADGSAWVTTMGASFLDQTCNRNSTVSHWQLVGDSLEQLSETEVGSELKGIDIDFDGFVWVGSGGDDTVYRLDPEGNVVGAFQGGGIDAPWAPRIDDAGNVWVANFGVMDVVPPNNIYRNAALSVLAGPNSPSGLPIGAPISPSTGYTLPSAGEPVLLSDGTPLSETGDGGQPAFTPLMRAVSAVPDRAGNVWVSNNWKPNFTSDLVGDPGGDGMVIFIGLAAPTEPGRTQ